MADLKKSWASALNNVFSSAVDQAVQYREAFHGLKVQALAAGAALQLSGNGVAADANDNLPAAASVTYGTEGAEILSYFVLRMALNWVDGGDVYLLFVANNAAADATPQTFDVYASTSPFVLDGAPLQNRPTAPGEVSWTGINLIPHAAAAPARFHASRTTIGDLVFGVSTDGTGVLDFGCLFVRLSKAAPFNREGNFRCAMFVASPGGGVGAFHQTPLLDANNWRAFDNAGAPLGAGTILAASYAFNSVLFTNGLSAVSGDLIIDPLVLTHSAAAGRRLGPFEDIGVAPALVSSPETDINDQSVTRHVSIDSLAIPVTASQLQIVL
mgnify:CR=1 FL=1